MNDLDPLELKEGLEDAEELSGFSNSLRDEEVVYGDLGVLFKIVPAAELGEVLEQLYDLVSPLYDY